jgi:hypothetical protein
MTVTLNSSVKQFVLKKITGTPGMFGILIGSVNSSGMEDPKVRCNTDRVKISTSIVLN